MQFQVTDIEFDCSLDDDDWTSKDQLETEESLPHAYIGTMWDADSEEDLIEEISCASGWCIKTIDYRAILKWLLSLFGFVSQSSSTFSSKTSLIMPDFSTIVENYAQFIIDGMDYKTLEQYAYDMLVDSLTKDYESADELMDEIREQYDEETLNDLMP